MHCEVADNQTEMRKKRKEEKTCVAMQSLNAKGRFVQMPPVVLFGVHMKNICKKKKLNVKNELKLILKLVLESQAVGSVLSSLRQAAQT